jgi:hypothetical protein
VDKTLVDIAKIEKDAAEIYEAGMNLMRFMMTFNIMPKDRAQPLREELDRRPKARKLRQAKYEAAPTSRR